MTRTHPRSTAAPAQHCAMRQALIDANIPINPTDDPRGRECLVVRPKPRPTKVCGGCGERKYLGAFSAAPTDDGLTDLCRLCIVADYLGRSAA